MELSFERVIDCGRGSSPQAVHDSNNLLRIIYLTEDHTAACWGADPTLGLYGNLVFRDYGRISPDEAVSLPSLKRVAHQGAFGFWNASGDHRFVIYMMPTDISNTLIDGNVKYRTGNAVSSVSCSLMNIRGELLNRHRALVTPGTKLRIYFSLGDSEELPLGVFYIDRAQINYPEESVSISGRNAIGKLLKEQTFDEHTEFDLGSLQENIKSILDHAGVEDYFVGDPGINQPLAFEPDDSILEGITYAVSLIPGWKLEETADGVVGIAAKDDARFDQTGIYTFARERNCWSYSVEYDDSDASSRVCAWCNTADEGSGKGVRRVYTNVEYNKWWTPPGHRTLYIQAAEDTSEEQLRTIAQSAADVLAISGRVEAFAGIFTPQLVLGDEVHVLDEHARSEVVGTVTDVTHSFGQKGFHTSFTVDSGGRKHKTTLADLISSASKKSG